MEQNHMLPIPATRTLPAATAGLDQKQRLLHNDHRRQASPPSDKAGALLPSLDRTFKLPLYPPPSYSQSHPDTKPSVGAFNDGPKTELAPIKAFAGVDDGRKKGKTLPSLSALTGGPTPLYPPPAPPLSRPTHPPEPTYAPPPIPEPPRQTHWPSLNPLTAYYTPSHAESSEPPLRMEVDSTSNSVGSTASPQSSTQDGRASSVTLDDPDVRMAAEALGDLRADFVSSPPNRSTPLPNSPGSQSNAQQPEPLLSLLTTQHPFVGQFIEGTASAYNASKNISPRIRSSVEYVEGYVAPIANTVGTVGRATGVEGGVRWFLGGGRRTKSDLEAAEQSSSKRRRVDNGAGFVAHDDQQDEPMGGAETPRPTYDPNDPRRLSIASTIDTLPAYDEYRSPAYSERPESRPTSVAWQSRIIMSTSGLSIAMSEESLRSLKYCLSWLRWANVHIGNVIDKLKTVMEKMEKPTSQEGGEGSSSASSSEDKTDLTASVAKLRADVLKTLQDVINTVSKYAGGALPENARVLVRRHLTSLPQRFMVASMTSDGQQRDQATPPEDLSAEEAGAAREKEAREGAQRVLVLAREGLDMMAQVSGVLDGTIVSAEEWCERLGRKRRQQRESLYDGPAPTISDDDKMETR